MSYLKKYKLFEAIQQANSLNESFSLEEDVVYDLNDILVDLDFVNRTAGSQEITFSIDKNIISIFGRSGEPFTQSIVKDVIDRTKDYLESVGCKSVVKYGGRRMAYNDQRIAVAVVDKIIIEIEVNNFMMLRATYTANNYYMLYKDDDIIVVLNKDINMYRTYYIAFRKVKDKNSIYSSLQMVYNSNSRNFINFKVYDNHNNEIKWNSLPEHLRKGGIDYGIFNNGWGYIEGNFNNQGYGPA